MIYNSKNVYNKYLRYINKTVRRLDRSTKTQTKIARITGDVLYFRDTAPVTHFSKRKGNTSSVTHAVFVCVFVDLSSRLTVLLIYRRYLVYRINVILKLI